MRYFLSQTVHACMHCARRDELPNLTEIATNAEKDTLRGFNVTEGHLIWHQPKRHMRLPILVVNSNLGRLHDFGATVTYNLSNALAALHRL